MTFILQTLDGKYHVVTVQEEIELKKLPFWDKVTVYTKKG